jgi:hypothetical protein
MQTQEGSSRGSMAAILRQIAEARNETYRRVDFDVTSQGGPPASVQEIDQVEAAVGFPLPRYYREFLSIHNGWEYWSGDVAFLSTYQIMSGEYAESISKWKAEQHEAGNLMMPDALVIAFSLFVGEQIFIDVASSSGEEVIVWDREETARFPNLLKYFEAFLAMLEEELRDPSLLG